MPPLKSSIHGRAARLVLNEPASLNALSPAMIELLREQLRCLRHDAAIDWIVLEGAGGKAFSAGADVRAMWRYAVAGDCDAIIRYFAREYEIDLMLADSPKAIVALVDGICFGGGMGLAMQSSHCVVSEAASFAMPETLIGFFPDAGATWFLPKLSGSLGLYFGLTGARIAGPDAVRLGLASHFVPKEHFSAVAAEILAEGPDRLVGLDFALPPSSLQENRARIDHCFGAGSLQGIFDRLERDGTDWAKETSATLHDRSPASLAWAFESLSHPRQTLADCLQAELALVGIATRHPDFQEGIRAALIDKDKTPRWQPAGQ
jgi:enoyl-CoA hydratase